MFVVVPDELVSYVTSVVVCVFVNVVTLPELIVDIIHRSTVPEAGSVWALP